MAVTLNTLMISLNGRLRDELPNREILTTLTEVKILIKQWWQEYNHIRPHRALRYRPPAPEAILPTLIPVTLILKAVQLLGRSLDYTPFFTARSIGRIMCYELLRQQDLYLTDMDICMLNEHQELR